MPAATLLAGGHAFSVTLCLVLLSGMFNPGLTLREGVCSYSVSMACPLLQAKHEAGVEAVSFEPICDLCPAVLDRQSSVFVELTSSSCSMPSSTPWTPRSSWSPQSHRLRIFADSSLAWVSQ